MCGASDIAIMLHTILPITFMFITVRVTHIYIHVFTHKHYLEQKKTVDLTHTNKLGKIFSYCSPVTIPTIKPLNFQDFTSSG